MADINADVVSDGAVEVDDSSGMTNDANLTLAALNQTFEAIAPSNISDIQLPLPPLPAPGLVEASLSPSPVPSITLVSTIDTLPVPSVSYVSHSTVSSATPSHSLSLSPAVSVTPTISAVDISISPTMTAISSVAASVLASVSPSPVVSSLPSASLTPAHTISEDKHIDTSVLVHAWIPFTFAWVVCAAFTLSFVLLFKSKTHSKWQATLLCALTCITTLALFILLPVDVFLVSASKMNDGTLAAWASEGSIEWVQSLMSHVYMGLYTTLLLLIFFVLPFAFFYFDEPGPETAPPASRAFFGIRNTAGFVVVVLVLLLIALLAKPDTHPKDTPDDSMRYVLDILQANAGERGVYLCVGVLTMVGLFIWCTYVAWGLVFLPLALLMKPPVAHTGANGSESHERDSQRLLDGLSDDDMDADEYDMDDEEVLVNVDAGVPIRNSRDGGRGSSTNANLTADGGVVTRISNPEKKFAGAVFLFLSLLVVSAVFLNSLDRSLHSMGLSYGFTLASPQYPSPMDWLLMHLHKNFPLDIIFLMVLMFYTIVCALAGLRAIGVRFLGVKLYDVRSGGTTIHGLLLISVSLALIIMSMHISMLTLAPQYVMFGSQTYINNGTIVPCETSPHDGGVCTITRAAAFSQRLSYNYPVFGAVVFGMNWLFLFIVALATPVVIIVQRRPTLKHDLGGVMGMAGTDRTNNRSASARDRDNRPLTAGIGLDDGDDDSDYDDFDDYNEMESL